MPSSSCSSRISVSSGRSPASTLPPGNSQSPAMVFPAGRSASSTRPSASIRAQAATRTSLMLTGRSRAVVAVDRHVLLGEIAGQNAVLALAKPERDLERDDVVLHRLRYHRFVVARIARALVGDADAVEPDR